jgi:hypothetical protein
MIRPQPGSVGIRSALRSSRPMFRAFTRAADPAAARPRVNAVSAGWPRRYATTAAHKVSTGARLIPRGMTPAKPEVGALARATRQQASAAVICPSLVRPRPRSHAPEMFVVSEAEATAIRTAFDQGGEFAAAVELRRLFPGVTDA